jgi:hypothetical protein
MEGYGAPHAQIRHNLRRAESTTVDDGHIKRVVDSQGNKGILRWLVRGTVTSWRWGYQLHAYIV